MGRNVRTRTSAREVGFGFEFYARPHQLPSVDLVLSAILQGAQLAAIGTAIDVKDDSLFFGIDIIPYILPLLRRQIYKRFIFLSMAASRIPGSQGSSFLTVL